MPKVKPISQDSDDTLDKKEFSKKRSKELSKKRSKETQDSDPKPKSRKASKEAADSPASKKKEKKDKKEDKDKEKENKDKDKSAKDKKRDSSTAADKPDADIERFDSVAPKQRGFKSHVAAQHGDTEIDRATGTIVVDNEQAQLLRRIGQEAQEKAENAHKRTSISSNDPDFSPHKRIPKHEFQQKRQEIKAQARLDKITKDGLLLDWFWTNPATIGKYSQSLGLELYVRFVKYSKIIAIIWSFLVLPLIIACSTPSDSDAAHSASGLAIISLASFGNSAEHAAIKESLLTGEANVTASSTSTGADVSTAALVRALEADGQMSTIKAKPGESFPGEFAFRNQNITLELSALGMEDATYKITELTPWLALLSALGSFIFFFFVVFFTHKSIQDAAEVMDAKSITPGDFTVMVEKLPERLDDIHHHDYKEQLAKHFEKVMNDERYKKKNNTACFGCIKRPQWVPPIKPTVEDVSIVYDFNGKLKTFMDDIEMKTELAKAIKYKDEKKQQKLQRKIDYQLEQKLKSAAGRHALEIKREDRFVLRAYVTVGLAFDRNVLVDSFRLSQYGILRSCQSRRKRFYNGTKIKVSESPEPTNILWENQDIPKSEQTARICATTTVSVILILVSMGLLLAAKFLGEQEQKKMEGENSSVCSNVFIPKLNVTKLLEERNTTSTIENSNADGATTSSAATSTTRRLRDAAYRGSGINDYYSSVHKQAAVRRVSASSEVKTSSSLRGHAYYEQGMVSGHALYRGFFEDNLDYAKLESDNNIYSVFDDLGYRMPKYLQGTPERIKLVRRLDTGNGGNVADTVKSTNTTKSTDSNSTSSDSTKTVSGGSSGNSNTGADLAQSEKSSSSDGAKTSTGNELVQSSNQLQLASTNTTSSGNATVLGDQVMLSPESAKAFIAAQLELDASYDGKDIFGFCECSQIGEANIVQDPLLRTACESFVWARGLLIFIGVVSAFTVAVINIILKTVLTTLSKWERPLTVSQLESSIVVKVFISQFMNTGIINLLLQSKRLFGSIFTNAEHIDYSHKWYATVGTAIATTMAINTASPHGIGVVKAKFKQAQINCCAATCVTTINGLRSIYDPPDFELAARCGAFLNTMFVSVMYCPGCPILVPFMVVNFMLVYVCDKYVLLKVSKRPPAWDEKVMDITVKTLRFAFILNAINGIWMLGNPQVFPSDDFYGLQPGYKEHIEPHVLAVERDIGTDGDDSVDNFNLAQLTYYFTEIIKRSLTGSGFPFFLFFISIIVYFVLLFTWFVFKTSVGTILQVMYESMFKTAKVTMTNAEDRITWIEAQAEMEEAKIVSTYLVEDHPKYKKMFEGTDFSLDPNSKKKDSPSAALGSKNFKVFDIEEGNGKVEKKKSPKGKTDKTPSSSKGKNSPDSPTQKRKKKDITQQIISAALESSSDDDSSSGGSDGDD